MPVLREIGEGLFLAHNENYVNDYEIVFLYENNKSKNPYFSYWTETEFDLDWLHEDECFRMNESFHEK